MDCNMEKIIETVPLSSSKLPLCSYFITIIVSVHLFWLLNRIFFFRLLLLFILQNRYNIFTLQMISHFLLFSYSFIYFFFSS